MTYPQQPPAFQNPYANNPYANPFAAPPVPESILVRHVRETLPFVVKLSGLKLAWRSTYLFMIFLAVIGALFTALLVSEMGPSALLFIPIFAAFALVIMPFVAWGARKPVLGADQAGIWVKVFRARKTVFLPWEAVGAVRIGTFAWHHELCVDAKDPAVDQALYPAAMGNLEQQAGQAMVNRRARKKLGTNIHTPLTGAPMSHEDLLAQLRYYSAGRCPIG